MRHYGIAAAFSAQRIATDDPRPQWEIVTDTSQPKITFEGTDLLREDEVQHQRFPSLRYA